MLQTILSVKVFAMIQVSRHAIKRYKERITPCSDFEAELRILDAAIHGILLSQKGKYKAIKHGPAVLIIYSNNGIDTVKTVEHIKFSGWWKKRNGNSNAVPQSGT